ncbi:hypothetical protein VPHD69_0323 [Vibrio phage D69]
MFRKSYSTNPRPTLALSLICYIATKILKKDIHY